MSAFTEAFDELYAVQTENLGVAVVATVTGACISKAAIIGTNTGDPIYLEGSTGVTGGYELQMKASDFTSPPVKNMQVTCNGNASGETLQVLASDLANGIYILRVGDISQ